MKALKYFLPILILNCAGGTFPSYAINPVSDPVPADSTTSDDSTDDSTNRTPKKSHKRHTHTPSTDTNSVTTNSSTKEPAPSAEPEASTSISGSGHEKVAQKKNETAMKGLGVIELGQGKMVGQAFEVIATKGTTEGAHFSMEKIGPMMHQSLRTVFANLKVIHPTWGIRGVTISFENNYQPYDGPSASTVFALLITSLQEGIDLDQKVAMTGDLSADMNVRPIGGVQAKIMGAINGDCVYVGIPQQNSRDLLDTLILRTPDYSLITKTQVLSLTSYKEALTLARVDRPTEFQEGLDEYALLASTLSPYAPLTSDQVAKLQDVLRRIPNHLSAKLLLARNENKWPKTISLRTSSDVLGELVNPFYARVVNTPKMGSTDLKFSQEFYEDTMKRFNAMKPYIHKDAQQLANHFENIVRDWRSVAFRADNDKAAIGSIRASIDELNRDIDVFRTDVRKLISDETTAYELF